MIPKPSPFGGLTRRGRLRNAWAKAAAEPDPARCLDRLRAIWPAFAAKPTTYADLWPAFLDFVLRGHAAPALTPVDLTALADIGFRLTARPSPGLRQWDAVRPLLTAWDARRQPRAACALLTRMYRAPDVSPEERTAIARSLVNRGARGDDQLAIYVEHLRGAGSVRSDQPMQALLADCLTVGFGADPIRLRRAGELAATLREARLPVPGVDLALGFADLLVDRRYADAVGHLERARAAQPANQNALLGLVSAWTHNGDHDLVAAVARVAGGPAAPVLAAMGELSGMLAWLDDPVAPGPPPVTPARLAQLDVRMLAGDWLDFAVGRAHLLAGGAGQAADLLVPLAERHPEYPQWAYHAAWALSLRGDRDGVARWFEAVRDWSAAWTVGCVLLDADPGEADRVAEELDRRPPPAEHAEVLAARLAMARRQRPEEPAWRLVEAPVPEALESLRTMLGLRLTGGSPAPLDEAARAVLAHLPVADQLLWDGLAALSTDRGRGRALLERAAHRLGYPRAALVLAVHHLEEARYGEAEHLLARFDWRTDRDFQVLRAWARARTDQTATADLERLAEQESSRAHYALGSVYIGRLTASSADRRQVLAHQAAAEFRAALSDPGQPVPADAAALARCAELLDTGAPAAVDGAGWAEFETLPAPRRTSWLRWLIAVAELAGEPASCLLDAGEYLVSNMDDAGPDGSVEVPRGVGQALTRASLADTDPARAGALTDLVSRLARRPDPELARLHDLASAAVARAGGPTVTLDGAPAARLVKAELALRDDDPETAARELRAVKDLAPVTQLAPVLADLLTGRLPGPDSVLEIPPDLPDRTALAVRVTEAAQLAEIDADRSVAVLAPVIGDLVPAELVNLRRGLRLLCAGVARRREPAGPLPDLILGMAADRDDDDLDLVMLARCAAAVGDQQLAGMLWRDAVAEPAELTEEARAEYTKFLCHQAVRARKDGDVLEAVHQLLLAARVGSGRRLDRSAFAADEVAALNEVFRTAVAELSSSAARNRTKGDWAAMTKCLTAARDAGDERRAVLMFAQLEDLLALVERGEV